MAQRFPVIPLNQPLRIYDFTVRQLVALALMSFFMLLLVTQIDKTWILAGLPARFLLSVIGFSCAIVVVRMSDVRPMIWWKRQLLYYGKPIPVRLPDVHWSDKPDSPATLLLNNNSRVCLKVRKEEFEALEEDKKQKILDSLVEFIEALDFTPGRSEDLQMLCSPMYSSPTMEDVDIISSRAVNSSTRCSRISCSKPDSTWKQCHKKRHAVFFTVFSVLRITRPTNRYRLR